MDKSRDSSVLRSLAVAFGDGLAFGVGMKLTQNAAGKPGAPAPSDLAGRLARVEQHVELVERTPASVAAPNSANLDPNILEALTHALEARLQEASGSMDRRLAEFEVKLAVELKALRQQDQALASATEIRFEEIHQQFNQQAVALVQKVNEDRNALQTQVVALHREFAAAVADIVEEQVANQVEQRVAREVGAHVASLKQELRDEIQQASAAKYGEIADLRQRVTENDRNVLDVLLAMGDLFRQAAGRLGAPKAPAEINPAPLAVVEALPLASKAPMETMQSSSEAERAPLSTTETSTDLPEVAEMYLDSELPGFVHPRKARAIWSVPLVSSFLITAGCVLALQYL